MKPTVATPFFHEQSPRRYRGQEQEWRSTFDSCSNPWWLKPVRAGSIPALFILTLPANQYFPGTVPPPGETLRETLEGLGMSQKEFSTRMGLSEKHVCKVIAGDAALSPETALSLEKVLGIPARFWSNLEMNYQEHLARKREAETLKEVPA